MKIVQIVISVLMLLAFFGFLNRQTDYEKLKNQQLEGQSKKLTAIKRLLQPFIEDTSGPYRFHWAGMLKGDGSFQRNFPPSGKHFTRCILAPSISLDKDRADVILFVLESEASLEIARKRYGDHLNVYPTALCAVYPISKGAE